jgi:putative sugar O-methyltransferase
VKAILDKLLNSLHSARIASALRANMMRVANQGEAYFEEDARYNLGRVTAGHVSNHDETVDDTSMLERICNAYQKSAASEPPAPRAYRATDWWEQHRKGSLQPVIRALTDGDIPALRDIYRNFYRNSCSAGLIAPPYRLSGVRGNKDVYRRFCMSDVLYRLQYWKEKTGNRFSYSDLSISHIGNPFGVYVDGTLIAPRAEYHHYYAQKIIDKLRSASDSDQCRVVEIGGGFGAMAHFLLRDQPGLTYIDFDVSESIALASYYLMKSRPDLSFHLYGEGELTEGALAAADVILLPAHEVSSMPAQSAGITFCSHLFSDLPHDALQTYLDDVRVMTRDSFIFVADTSTCNTILEGVSQQYSAVQSVVTGVSKWHEHLFPGWDELECLICLLETDADCRIGDQESVVHRC